MKLEGMWVGEWSASQGLFRRQPLDEALRGNIRRAQRGEANDRGMIAVGTRGHTLTCGLLAQCH